MPRDDRYLAAMVSDQILRQFGEELARGAGVGMIGTVEKADSHVIGPR